jgi:hypothetical protein
VTGRRAFVSTGVFNPSSGVAAADSLCQNEGDRSFLALLSTGQSSATARFDLTVPTWVRPDGIPWLDDPTKLAAGEVLAALNVDVARNYRGYTPVWTGSTTPGMPSAGVAQSCGDWSSSSGSQTGIIGRAEYSDGLFFNSTPFACSNIDDSSGNGARLYCLQCASGAIVTPGAGHCP